MIPLLDIAFNQVVTPKKYEKLANFDPRLKGTPIGFCAVEHSSVIGFVGVMHLLTRTPYGERSKAGGIYWVATLPGHTRRGVCTTLMNHAHNYFSEMGFSVSFLTTNRSLVSHSLYLGLGYVEILENRSAYKMLAATSNSRLAKPGSSEFDHNKMMRIYKDYTKDKVGLVLRNKNHFQMLKKVDRGDTVRCFVEKSGYVIYETEKDADKIRVCVKELIALDFGSMNRLLDLVESESTEVVYDRTVIDDCVLRAYRSKRYMVQSHGNTVIMAKPLTCDVSIKDEYGPRFFATGTDFPKK